MEWFFIAYPFIGIAFGIFMARQMENVDVMMRGIWFLLYAMVWPVWMVLGLFGMLVGGRSRS